MKEPTVDLAKVFYDTFLEMEDTEIELLTSKGFAPKVYQSLTIVVSHHESVSQATFTKSSTEGWDVSLTGDDTRWFIRCFEKLKDSYEKWLKEEVYEGRFQP